MKSKNWLAFLCLALVFSTLLTFVGCTKKDDPKPGDKTEESTGTEDTTTPEDEGDPWLDYPEQIGKQDFNGREFKIAALKGEADNFFISHAPDEFTGYAVSDALFTRDQYMMEEYGIDVQYQLYSGGDDGKELCDAVSTAISGNLPLCDMISSTMYASIYQLGEKNFLYNMNDMTGLNYDAPWWASYFVEGAEFNNRLYYAADMASGAGYFGTVYAMICNLRLANDVYLADGSQFDIFQLIEDGEWTVEVMTEVTKDYAMSTDGDDKIDVMSDRLAYSHVATPITAGCHFIAAGGKYSSIGSDGHIVVDIGGDETLALVDDLANMFNTLKTSTSTEPDFWNGGTFKAFTGGRALFFGNSITYVNHITNMKDDYAIIPCPKGSVEQPDYLSGVNLYSGGFMAFASNITDPEFVAYAAEMLGYHSYYIVKPAVYDETLCLRLAKDPRQVEIMDTIYSNLYIDLNFIHNFGESRGIVENCILNIDKQLATEYATIKKVLPIFVGRFEERMGM